MIDSVWIRDFRGIHTAHITGLRSINVLVGPNNSGKTAFLEALYLGCGVTGSDGMRLAWAPKYHPVMLPTMDLVGEQPLAVVRRKHLHQPNKPPMVRVGDVSSPTALSLMIRPESPNPRLREFNLYPVVRDSSPQEDWPLSRLQQLAYFRSDIDLLLRLGDSDWSSGGHFPPAIHGVPMDHAIYFWDRSFTYQYVGRAAWRLFGTPPAAKHTFFYDAQQTLAHIPTEFYNTMLGTIPGWSKKIAQRVARVLGIEEPFQIAFTTTGANREWTQGQIAFDDRPALPIDDFGDGARAVFKVLAPLIALAELVTEEEPGIFLWEEPELFQNPLTLGRLLAEVADLAQSRPLQVFMATHSLEVVAHLVQQVQAGTLKEEALCTLTTQLHKGAFTAQASSTDQIRTWTRMQRDLRVPDGYTGSPLHFSMDAPADTTAEDGDGDE